MNIITPAEATIKLKGHVARMERLKANKYKRDKELTQDLNKLKAEHHKIVLWASIAIHNRNLETALNTIGKVRMLREARMEFIRGYHLQD